MRSFPQPGPTSTTAPGAWRCRPSAPCLKIYNAAGLGVGQAGYVEITDSRPEGESRCGSGPDHVCMRIGLKTTGALQKITEAVRSASGSPVRPPDPTPVPKPPTTAPPPTASPTGSPPATPSNGPETPPNGDPSGDPSEGPDGDPSEEPNGDPSGEPDEDEGGEPAPPANT
ncbi:hypothetical protein DPM19_31155 [Actinomadura craniellae]|uniref:Uncharacterized protein n=1 Tax=Actinomadura craniellae TaxID=2231787 RepID=A0A365GWM6_9ACTN|nr:hypothetical protein [Actinomadura craniellae]RAY11219.1 hypothetical protein DPM19_31155 [Actinomadura craniellae]